MCLANAMYDEQDVSFRNQLIDYKVLCADRYVFGECYVR